MENINQSIPNISSQRIGSIAPSNVDGHGSGHNCSTDESSEESEEDSSSSSYSLDVKVMNMEKDFKKLLKRCDEYENTKFNAKNKLKNNSAQDILDDKAKTLYLKGMIYEKDNNITDALQCYRKATKLVPDIDIKISKALSFSLDDRIPDKKKCHNILSKSELVYQDLVQKFEISKKENDIVSQDSSIVDKNLIQAINHNITKCVILNKLPKEIMLYIICWAISTELDFKCLETLSKVCRLFYLYARDKGPWYLGCQRIWGPQKSHSLSTPPHNYTSWRDMYIHRPHPRYEGYYVSRATYWRYGEANIENSYMPCYAIRHFRYLKFSAKNHLVKALFSPEPPHVIVGGKVLEQTSTNPPFSADHVLHGKYRLTGPNELSLVLVKKTVSVEPCFRAGGKFSGRQANASVTCSIGAGPSAAAANVRPQNTGRRIGMGSNVATNVTTYYMKFVIQPTSRGRPNCKLVWRHYSIFIKYNNGNKSKTVFDLSQDKYPPFSFFSSQPVADIEEPLT